LTRRVVFLLVLTMALVTAVPQQDLLQYKKDPFPLSWLWNAFALPASWSSPAMPPTPQQQGGTAAGKAHRVPAGSTRAGGGAGRAPGKGAGQLNTYQAHKKATVAGKTAPQPNDQSFSPTTSKRIAAQSTATSDVYQNADGSRTSKMYEGPVNYQAANGTWTPIDTGLSEGGDGRQHERGNRDQVDFAPAADDPALTSMKLPSGESLSYSLQGAAHVAPTIDGSTATYPAALPQTDLTLTTTGDGIRENLILNSPDAANSWVFPLRLNGLTARLSDDGSVQYLDAKGTVVETTPAAYMQDSAFDPHSMEPAESHVITYELVTVDGGPALKMTADPTWLHDPARVFPVTVDPDFDETADTFAEYPYNNDNSSDTALKVGYNGAGNKAYSFLKFDGFFGSFTDAHINSVNLHLFDMWAWTCSAEPFSVNPITSAWSPSTTKTYPGPSFGAAIGSLTAEPGAACSNTGASTTKGTWMSVPLNVSTFNSWSVGGTNNGLAITASQTDDRQWKQFDSNNTANMPYLSVTYSADTAPQIDSQFPADNDDATTLTPELMASGHDPDNYPNTSLTYDFVIYSVDASGNQTVLKDSGYTASSTYTVPSGVLKWGQSYFWSVTDGDGATHSDPNDTLQVLNTPVPQPAITSGLSQNSGGHGFDPSIGNYTTSATDAQVATVGPSLSVDRDYNSSDPRTGGAFGAGWSSVFDAKATDTGQTVVVTYPDGSEVAYGRNADGTFAPPQGRFATFAGVSGGGFTLTDKNDTGYKFTQSLGGGVWGITAITDASGHAETFGYTSNQLTSVTSASGRALHLTWTTPGGGAVAHVATVATDPVGSPAAALTWTYNYTGDLLSAVCPPTSSTACTAYGYGAASQYPHAAMDQGPHSYWRLDETGAATSAASSVLVNAHNDDATYTNVTLGGPASLPGSSATSASFNGTSSNVKLPATLVQGADSQTISMWFKTSTPNGVLFSYQADPITNPTTPANYTPALYVGNDGKLLGEFWYPGGSAIQSSTSVTDGNWHHVALATTGNAQSLYLDGALVGSRTGVVSIFGSGGTNNEYVGAGFLGGGWPDEINQGKAGGSTAFATFFNGSISDVAFYTSGLSASAVGTLYSAGHRSGNVLTSVTRPSGTAFAQVSYDGVTGDVSQVTDETGGTWQVGAPTVSGSSQIYAASVLGSAPEDYWRMGESDGQQPINQVHSGVATYNSVGVGATGPFGDSDPDTAVTFDGSSSYMQLPSNLIPANGPASIELWFRTTSSGAVLIGDQSGPMGTAATGAGPFLWVGTDGKLYGGFWTTSGSRMMNSGKAVNDGNWHQATLTGSGASQVLYLDGQVATSSTGAAMAGTNEAYVYVGAQHTGAGWTGLPNQTNVYFNGTIDEVSLYTHALSAEDVSTQYAAYKSASSSVAPMVSVKVTDPTGAQQTDAYDPDNGYRQVSTTDAYGDKTTYGYDTSGFLNTVTDPDGNVTITGHDVRGNTVSQTTCQNQASNKCSTVYYTYYPNDTAATLTPDPRNDLLLTMRDGRSSSATDNTYLTSYTYDTAGNRLTETTPPVPGYPSGRTTSVAYTTATTAAADTGSTPPGLPATTTSPGGSVQSVSYNHDGDVAQTTDAAGQVTRYAYDALGRVAGTTAVSDSYPAGLTTSYVYNGVGEPVTETDPPITNRVTGAVHTARTSTVYDDDGDMTSQTVEDLTGGDASRTVSATYNSHDQKVTETDPAGDVTHLGYDADGNQNQQIDPSGNETDYGYDDNGHLLTTTLKNFTGDPANPGSARDLVESSRAYDPAGRLASMTDSMGFVTAYTYTDDGKVATVTRSDPSTHSSFVQQDNTYDAAGNLVSQKTNNEQTLTNFTVDAASRTTSATLDPSNLNRTTSYAFSPDDEVLNTTVKDPHGSQSTDATYDPMGRPTSSTVHLDGAGHPAGWWQLNETSGTSAADSSGAGQTAIASPGITWSNGAATFNGSTGVIATPGPVLNTAQSYSVSAWVNLTSTSTFYTAVAQGGSNAAEFYLQYSKGYNAWTFVANSTDSAATTQFSAHASTAPALNTWTHLVGVFNSANGAMQLYVNGTLSATVTDTSPWNAAGPLSIGGVKLVNGSVSNTVAGSVDNVQVYQRALSSSDVSTLYGGGSGRTGSALAANTITTKVSLDQRGLPTAQTDPDGNVTSYSYDEAGRLAVTTDPTVSAEVGGGTPAQVHPVSMAGYDTFGSQTETSDPNGNVTVTAYDALSRPTSTTMPNYTPPGSSTPITAVTSTTYNKLNQALTDTDPLGHVTSYTYDQLGDTASMTAPNGGVTHYTYDTNGDPLSTTDPVGAVTQATYDYLGRQLTSTQVVRQPSVAALTTTSAYTDPAGFLSAQTTPAGVTSSYTSDAAGETTAVADGVGDTTRYAYDFAGRTVKTTLPDSTAQTTTYDAAGRAVSTATLDATGATLSSASSTYDADGNVLSATDPNGHATTFQYDATGAMTSEVQPVSATSSITTSFGYDAAGNQTRYTDGRGNPFITTYNKWNLPDSTIEPSTSAYPNLADRTFTTVYDAAGQVVSQRSPGGVDVTNSYDTVGDLTGQTGSGADAATADRSFGYDLDGQLKTASAPGGTDTFNYDDRGLLLSATGPSGNSSFGYTADGLMNTRTDADGTTSYTYDTLDRLATLTNTTSSVSASYNYNALSQPSTIAYGSGGDTRNFGYDTQHRLTSDTLKTPDGTTVASIGYGYDADGNLTAKTTSHFLGASANTYTYDYANRLTSWNNGTTTAGYNYDASGNRTQAGTQTFAYDARDQLTSGAGSTYTYTARGTLSSTSGATVTQTTSDAFGQAITQGTQTYAYDSLGRMVTATGVTSLSYTGTDNTLAADGAASYTRDPGGGLVGVATSTRKALAWTDQHTDVVADFGSTATALAGSEAYDPLGNVTAASTNLLGNLGYQSGWTDPSTGRVNMASRWYNPATGQFDSRDTAGPAPAPNSADANPFAYVGDNPLGDIDPSGHCGMFSISCHLKAAAKAVVHAATAVVHAVVTAAKAVVHAVVAVAKAAWNVVTTVARAVVHATTSLYDKAKSAAKAVVKATVHTVSTVSHAVADAAAKAKQKAIETANTLKVAATNIAHTAALYAQHPTYALATAYHATVNLATATVHYAEAHAASIASFVVSTAAFMGCEAVLGAVTAGVGAVAGATVCGAISGALGAAAGYAVGAAQSGNFSWSALGKATLVGGIGGAAGGLLGGLGGKALSWLGGKAAGALGGLLRAGADDAASSGLADAADGVAGDAVSSVADDGAGQAAGAADNPGGGADEPQAGQDESEPESCPVRHSFAGSTLVVMADGSTKPIKDVKLGDKVKSTDPSTGADSDQSVVLLHDNHDTDLADVTVKAGDGTTSTLHTTWHHPFWDVTHQQWTEAEDLKPGTLLYTPDGTTEQVQSVKTWTGLQDMHDLTLATVHTYYVVAGTTPVLVHNCGNGTDPRVISVDSSGEATVLPVHEVSHSGSYPDVADNLDNAFENGKSAIVNRQTGRANIRANRNAAQAGLPRPGTLGTDASGGALSWEEYPFASTAQGGAGATTRLINLAQNVAHGRDSLLPFLTRNGIQDGDPYFVRTTP
jgi:RHS repeat-associated protein